MANVSRNIYNEQKRYVMSIVQEGIPWIDADENDGRQCLYNSFRQAINFLIGRGIPPTLPNAFAIQQSASVTANNFQIKGGGATGTDLTAARLWAGGHQCVLYDDVDFVNTGVPHVVVGVEDLMNHPVKAQGRALRRHGRFAPEGTNADFMKVLGPDRLEMRTYERGVEDETLACGTGAVACAVTASARGMVRPPVEVKTRGGESLRVYFQKKGDAFEAVWLEGNTAIVYEGRLHEEAL